MQPKRHRAERQPQEGEGQIMPRVPDAMRPCEPDQHQMRQHHRGPQPDQRPRQTGGDHPHRDEILDGLHPSARQSVQEFEAEFGRYQR